MCAVERVADLQQRLSGFDFVPCCRVHAHTALVFDVGLMRCTDRVNPCVWEGKRQRVEKRAPHCDVVLYIPNCQDSGYVCERMVLHEHNKRNKCERLKHTATSVTTVCHTLYLTGCMCDLAVCVV